jgi:ketosteroid isomerase-like protein
MTNEIRAARAASNAAIAARDVDTIVSFLLPSYQVVTARNATRHGRDASRESWTAIFASGVTYVRTPAEIYISENKTQAHENGKWEGGGLRGVYSAKWLRDENGAWRLIGEIFSTL